MTVEATRPHSSSEPSELSVMCTLRAAVGWPMRRLNRPSARSRGNIGMFPAGKRGVITAVPVSNIQGSRAVLTIKLHQDCSRTVTSSDAEAPEAVRSAEKGNSSSATTANMTVWRKSVPKVNVSHACGEAP